MSNASFVHLNTLLGSRLYGDLINHAARTGTPVSDIVNRAVEEYLAAHATPEDRRGRYEVKEQQQLIATRGT
jgi:hypothetical protein